MSKYVHIIEVITGQQNFSSQEELDAFIRTFDAVYPEQYNILLTKIQAMKDEGSMLTSVAELSPASPNVFKASKIFTTIQKAVEYHDWITQGGGQVAFSYICNGLGWTVDNTAFLSITEERWNEIQQEITAAQ